MGNPKVLNNYGSFDVTFVKGKGATCFDVNGKKYIDFLAGIAVNVLGHNFKPLVKAVSKQAKKQIHVCNYFTSDAGMLEYLNGKTFTVKDVWFAREVFGKTDF